MYFDGRSAFYFECNHRRRTLSIYDLIQVCRRELFPRVICFPRSRSCFAVHGSISNCCIRNCCVYFPQVKPRPWYGVMYRDGEGAGAARFTKFPPDCMTNRDVVVVFFFSWFFPILVLRRLLYSFGERWRRLRWIFFLQRRRKYLLWNENVAQVRDFHALKKAILVHTGDARIYFAAGSTASFNTSNPNQPMVGILIARILVLRYLII